MFPVLPGLLSEVCKGRRVTSQKEILSVLTKLAQRMDPSGEVISKETTEIINNLNSGHQAPAFSFRSTYACIFACSGPELSLGGVSSGWQSVLLHKPIRRRAEATSHIPSGRLASLKTQLRILQA